MMDQFAPLPAGLGYPEREGFHPAGCLLLSVLGRLKLLQGLICSPVESYCLQLPLPTFYHNQSYQAVSLHKPYSRGLAGSKTKYSPLSPFPFTCKYKFAQGGGRASASQLPEGSPATLPGGLGGPLVLLSAAPCRPARRSRFAAPFFRSDPLRGGRAPSAAAPCAGLLLQRSSALRRRPPSVRRGRSMLAACCLLAAC